MIQLEKLFLNRVLTMPLHGLDKTEVLVWFGIELRRVFSKTPSSLVGWY